MFPPDLLSKRNAFEAEQSDARPWLLGSSTYMSIGIDGSRYVGMATQEAPAVREKQLKGWSRRKKQSLARGNLRPGPSTRNLWTPLD